MSLSFVVEEERTGASVMLAYMMYKYKEGVNECLVKLRKCRPIVEPNPGFYSQLLKFENELGVKSKIPKPILNFEELFS